eukprot:gene29709-37033_t
MTAQQMTAGNGNGSLTAGPGQAAGMAVELAVEDALMAPGRTLASARGVGGTCTLDPRTAMGRAVMNVLHMTMDSLYQAIKTHCMEEVDGQSPPKPGAKEAGWGERVVLQLSQMVSGLSFVREYEQKLEVAIPILVNKVEPIWRKLQQPIDSAWAAENTITMVKDLVGQAQSLCLPALASALQQLIDAVQQSQMKLSNDPNSFSIVKEKAEVMCAELILMVQLFSIVCRRKLASCGELSHDDKQATLGHNFLTRTFHSCCSTPGCFDIEVAIQEYYHQWSVYLYQLNQLTDELPGFLQNLLSIYKDHEEGADIASGKLTTHLDILLPQLEACCATNAADTCKLAIQKAKLTMQYSRNTELTTTMMQLESQ